MPYTNMPTSVSPAEVPSVADMRDRLAEIQEDYIAAGRTPEESAREKASEILYVFAFYCVPVAGFIGGISIYRADVRKKIMKTREQCSDMNASVICKRPAARQKVMTRAESTAPIFIIFLRKNHIGPNIPPILGATARP